jgi:filamentous hemagglutinin family protein
VEQSRAAHARLIPSLAFGVSLVLLFAYPTRPVHATAPITSSGLHTVVTLSASPPAGQTQYDITGGTRPGGGVNLYHSFGNFNVPTNNIANFLNSGSVDLNGTVLSPNLPTANILGRINGGNPSSIFGMIQTNGPGGFPNANLFLMNPNGFLFGPTATINVGGMATFTTADYLRQTDNARFNAVAGPADLLLTAAPVAAFGFLGNNPAAIAIQGSTLQVAQGQSLSLVGGNQGFVATIPDNGNPINVPGGITMTGGKLLAPGGQINLASVASPGEVLAGTLTYAPNVNGQSFGALGAINVSKQSVVDVSVNGGGTVSIRGGQFVLDNSTISANVTGAGPVIDGAESVGHGIDIQVSQDAVIQNGGLLTTNVLSSPTNVTYGGVNIQADHIEIVGRGLFSPLGQGGTGIQSAVLTGAQKASSGDITIEANSIVLKGIMQLDARVTGSTTQLSTGNPGNITVTANQNIELAGTQFSDTITNGSGIGGNITFTSTHGNILESGNALPPGFTPTLGVPIPPVQLNTVFAQTIGASTGKPGNVTFNAPQGDVVLAGAIFPIQKGASVQTAGGGELNITANNLQLLNFSNRPGASTSRSMGT